MGRLNRSVAATKYVRREDGSFSVDRRADAITAEEPLEIRLDGSVVTTTMRTPGHDVELAHGFLHSEGLIRQAVDVATARYCAGATGPDGQNTYNVLDVERVPGHRVGAEASSPDGAGATGALPFPTLLEATPARLTVMNSACGVCGSASIESIMGKTYRPIAPVVLTPELILELPQRLRAEQVLFRKTGGIHAAAVFEADGTLLVAREDIGRHNAADKVIGHLLMNGTLDVPGRVLVMSSRASFELVQKAVMAGFSALITVSAASSLAVELARESGLTLVAFARENRFNLYAGELAG